MSQARNFADLLASGTKLTANKLDDNAIHGNRNLIINGAMQVAQRGTSSTGLGSDTSANFVMDRFLTSSNSAGRYTMSQNTITDLSGFANSLKLACTTADTSIASSEYLLFQHRFEGQDLQHLKKGTSNAETLTLSFYVKGNANATYTAELYDYDNTRQFSQRFNVTTSWNRISLTYAGDTTGAYDDDNALSLILIIWLHAGLDYTSGTQNTAWGAAVNNQRANSSDTSFFDSTSRTFEITGIQLEVGEATPFEHRSFGDELARCQRYFIPFQITSTWLNNLNSAGLYWHYSLPVEMRATPTCTVGSTIQYWSGGGSANVTPSSINPNKTGFSLRKASGLTNANGYHTGTINCDAEL